MKNIAEALLAVSALTLVGAVAVAIPRINAPPPQVQSITPSEIRSIRTGDGQQWAIVKLWTYRFHPEAVPNLDLRSVEDTKANPNYSVILLESDEPKPVLGWYLIKDFTGNWQLMPLDKHFENRYPEIFKRRQS